MALSANPITTERIAIPIRRVIAVDGTDVFMRGTAACGVELRDDIRRSSLNRAEPVSLLRIAYDDERPVLGVARGRHTNGSIKNSG